MPIFKKGLLFPFLLLGLFSIARGQVAANFKPDVSSGCTPLTINFTNNSTGQGMTYFWEFGNGNTSTKENPGAIYYKAGNYRVLLTVKDNNGKQDTASALIKVFGSPRAGLKTNITEGCPPLNVKMIDLSKEGSGKIISWKWEMGDGAVVKKRDYTHTYSGKGTYDVSLIITDENGCTDFLKEKDRVTVFASPIAFFSSPKTMACKPPFKVDFKNKSSGTGSLSYQWKFGDGNTSTSSDPSNSYSKEGFYNVSLMVKDGNGCKDSITKKKFIFIGLEKADFNFVQQACEMEEVIFTNSSYPAVNGSTYQWDFGDGGTSTDINPKYQYKKAGTYTVELIVTTPAGCVDKISGKITINPNPDINFEVDKNISCQTPFEVRFTNKTKYADSFSWKFGDKTTSKDKDPVHIYTAEGDYDITLEAKNNFGCSSKTTFYGWIRVKYPEAKFMADTVEGCIPLEVNFRDASVSSKKITKWEWNFGDGTFSTLRNPTHTFTKDGKFTVTLKITNEDGCTDIGDMEIKTGIPPHADFTVDKDSGCIMDMRSVSFKNLTNDTSPLADKWLWQFEGLEDSDKMHPQKDYDVKPGKYDVTLIAYYNGCPDTMFKEDFITIDSPYADFRFIFDDTCSIDTVKFENLSIGAFSYNWSFGDGKSSKEKDPTHIYNTSGKSYLVTLKVVDEDKKCSHSISKILAIPNVFRVALALSQENKCAPSKVDFSAEGPAGTKMEWDFGNGKTSKNWDEIVVYEDPGEYLVTLKGVSENGCEDRKNEVKVVVKGSFALARATPESGCTPLKVRLFQQTKTATYFIKKYWDLGNGDVLPANDSVTYYTYNKAPVFQDKGYDLKLVVEDGDGCVRNEILKVFPHAPRAVINKRFDPTCDSFVFHLSAPSGDSAGIAPVSYQWKLNGDIVSDSNRLKTTMYPDDHALIQLEMEDGLGCTNNAEIRFDQKRARPIAAFSADTLKASCPPLEVNFRNLTKTGLTKISHYEWSFGDGSVSDFFEPKKFYLTAGKYTVKLKVIDSIGCVDSVTGPDYIVVNGPKGTYSFNPSEGCLPLTVDFKSTTTGANKIQWDLGDGTIYEGAKRTHTYTRPADYIPVMILSDTFGCVYTLPPIDTIEVYPVPEVDFLYAGNCAGEPVQFTASQVSTDDEVLKYIWDFGDGNSGAGKNISHIYSEPGFYKVTLKGENEYRCNTLLSRKIKVRGARAGFSVSPYGCVGSEIRFFDSSEADTPIVNWEWKIGDAVYHEKDPTLKFDKKGLFDLTLVVTTLDGCHDTAVFPGKFMVGDTLEPEPGDIYRVNVVNNQTVDMYFKPYPDFDLGKYKIHRKEPGADYIPYREIIRIEDTFFVDPLTNTLDNSYCYKVEMENICGYRSDLNITPEHCTVELSASPGINSSLLEWNHYVGFDEVIKYEIFREIYGKRGRFEQIGVVPGTQDTFVDNEVICYAHNFYKVIAYGSGGEIEKSNSDTSGAYPLYQGIVPETNLVRATVEDDKDVLVEWERSDFPKFKHYLLLKSENGQDYYTYGDPFPRDDLAFLDKATDVHKKSFYYRIIVADTCGDISPTSNIGKSILLRARTSEDYFPEISWSDYIYWSDGVSHYDVEIKETDGKYKKLGSTPDGNTTYFKDKITDLNSLPEYCYRVIAHREDGTTFSISNSDCVEGISQLWVPNVFTPNGDGVNDYFEVKGIYLKTYEIRIFDRWGMRVYESENINHPWNGKVDGETGILDAYVYTIKAEGIDGKKFHFTGNVTLLR